MLVKLNKYSEKNPLFHCQFFFLLIFSVCGIHHLERAQKQWNFFECIWFVVVTFSTVGYGDHTPPDWPAQTFVMLMIITALVLLPIEVIISVISTIRIMTFTICIMPRKVFLFIGKLALASQI